MDNEERNMRGWNLCHNNVNKQVVIYVSQIVIIYIVIISCIANISLEKGDTRLWTTLLSSCLGYLLPAPTLKPK